jgi:hypothetical protein
MVNKTELNGTDYYGRCIENGGISVFDLGYNRL